MPLNLTIELSSMISLILESELKFPDFKVSTIEYSVEGEQKWTAGDDDKFFYELKEKKEEWQKAYSVKKKD